VVEEGGGVEVDVLVRVAVPATTLGIVIVLRWLEDGPPCRDSSLGAKSPKAMQMHRAGMTSSGKSANTALAARRGLLRRRVRLPDGSQDWPSTAGRTLSIAVEVSEEALWLDSRSAGWTQFSATPWPARLSPLNSRTSSSCLMDEALE
jgi:hypothetical protein